MTVDRHKICRHTVQPMERDGVVVKCSSSVLSTGCGSVERA